MSTTLCCACNGLAVPGSFIRHPVTRVLLPACDACPPFPPDGRAYEARLRERVLDLEVRRLDVQLRLPFVWCRMQIEEENGALRRLLQQILDIDE